jgi:hypothetical protein
MFGRFHDLVPFRDTLKLLDGIKSTKRAAHPQCPLIKSTISMPTATYNLFSTLPGEPNLGIWYLTLQQQEQQQQQASGQPVRLDADLVEWVASPAIVGGGPTRLSAGPYRYTYELEGEVIATNDPGAGRDWFLIPTNNVNTYLIAADPRGDVVWTAEERREPIKISPARAGEPNQLFKFVRRFE